MLAAALSHGRGKVSVEIDGCRIDDVWATGSRAWFEYHCWSSHEWPDAPHGITRISRLRYSA